jgi:hypothetical protein
MPYVLIGSVGSLLRTDYVAVRTIVDLEKKLRGQMPTEH